MVLVLLFLTSLRVITSGSVKLYNMSIPPTCHERAHTCLDTHIEAQHGQWTCSSSSASPAPFRRWFHVNYISDCFIPVQCSGCNSHFPVGGRRWWALGVQPWGATFCLKTTPPRWVPCADSFAPIGLLTAPHTPNFGCLLLPVRPPPCFPSLMSCPPPPGLWPSPSHLSQPLVSGVLGTLCLECPYLHLSLVFDCSPTIQPAFWHGVSSPACHPRCLLLLRASPSLADGWSLAHPAALFRPLCLQFPRPPSPWLCFCPAFSFSLPLLPTPPNPLSWFCFTLLIFICWDVVDIPASGVQHNDSIFVYVMKRPQ